ncbi:MAG: glycosyltransferase family 9 protein [Candidatus Omnitrophica bacterium]|nr:glycosyltransferase family 9 protein [Candidatus Omnitrophota bacterium]
MERKRILIIRTDRLGDVVLSTPVIRSLRIAYPESHIAFMVRPYAEDIVTGNPYLDEVILYDKYGRHRGFFATLLFGLKLRKKRFDTALILHPTNRAHMIAFLAGIPERIGYSKRLPMLLTTAISDEKMNGQKHELEYTLDVLRNIGVSCFEKSIYVPVKREDEDRINERLSQRGIAAGDAIITVHPGSSCPSKRWPIENFSSLINKVSVNYGFRIVLVSGSEEKRQVGELKRSLGKDIVDMSGETSVGELAALLKRSNLFISNDSGPVHVSTGVGTPNIVIFGRKQPGLSPTRWGPRGDGDIVFHKDAGCKVCLAHNCKEGFKCLRAVTVDEVFNAVRSLLDKKGRKDHLTIKQHQSVIQSD